MKLKFYHCKIHLIAICIQQCSLLLSCSATAQSLSSIFEQANRACTWGWKTAVLFGTHQKMISSL